jgi:hypothetical protein
MTADVAAASSATTADDGSSPVWDVGGSPGRLIVAWQNRTTRLIEPVGLLEHGPPYRFRYLRRAGQVEGFRPFLSFRDLERTYTSPNLFPLFSQRIMSMRRPDFQEFLGQLHLSRESTPWEQLARSEGRSSGDTVQVFPVPSVGDDGATTCRFLVHGIRHVTGGVLPELAQGQPLVLHEDPTNPYNVDAIRVCDIDGNPLGYVPDLLLDHLAEMRVTAPVTLTVEHVNGPEAPPHLRLLVRLDGHVRPGYEPMSGPRWDTYN